MRTEERDEEVRAAARAWLATPDGRRRQKHTLDAALLADFAGYSLDELRELYAPILAEAYAPGVVAAAAQAAQEPRQLMPAANDTTREPVVVVDHLSRLSAIDFDIARMRAYSLIKDPAAPGGFRIKFPVIYQQSIALAQKALEQNIRIGKELYDLERVRKYVTSLGEIVHRHLAHLDPAIIEAIADDIEALNQDFVAPVDAHR